MVSHSSTYFDLESISIWLLWDDCILILAEIGVIASLGCAVLLTFLILHTIHIENIINDREYYVN